MSFSVQYGEGVTRIVDFGKAHLRIALAMPVLGERNSESWPLINSGAASLSWSEKDEWLVGEAGDLVWVCALADAADAALERETGQLYRKLFRLLGDGWQLQRLWHYLPRINEPGAAGLERYRAFCRGRSDAFEEAFGKNFHTCLPAASAVGCEGESLVIYGCARRRAKVNYFENPLQVPAYRYSQTYGPRAPGFARASLTDVATVKGHEPEGSGETATAIGCNEIYISGTASIREERSLADSGITGQLEITVENLNRIAAECGLENFISSTPSDLLASPQLSAASGALERAKPVAGAQSSCAGVKNSDTALRPSGTGMGRRFKVYLRNAADYPEVSRRFEALLNAQDEVVYLRSDICRSELDLEIEASLTVDAR